MKFRKNRIPDWICPVCEKGVLNLRKGSFFSEETALSKEAHQHEAWEPEWITYLYSCILDCTNNKCREKVLSVGNGTVDWEEGYDADGMPVQEWYDLFEPQFFYPNLKIFVCPESTPDKVKDHLNQSFSLVFTNPSSALNHLRIALEELLNFMKVKRFNLRNRRRVPITLHKRIEAISSKYQSQKDLLLAVKWLGNSGSHSGTDLSMDDVLDAYEIMEQLLKEVFDKSAVRARSMARKINRKRSH